MQLSKFKYNLCQKIAKQYGVDHRVVRYLVDYPFKFVKAIMADDTDLKPIRLRYFGVFVPKKTYLDKLSVEVIQL